MGTILSSFRKAVCRAHKQGALVAYPRGPLIPTKVAVPFPVIVAVIRPLVVLSSLRSTPLLFPILSRIPRELPPQVALKLGAIWTLRTCPPLWVHKQ